MTIKGIFRIQLRSDLADTPSGAPRRYSGSPAKASGLDIEAASAATWDSTFASMSTDRPQAAMPFAAREHRRTPKELTGRWRLCRHAFFCSIVHRDDVV